MLIWICGCRNCLGRVQAVYFDKRGQWVIYSGKIKKSGPLLGAPQTRRKRVKAGGGQRLPRDHTVPPAPSCYPASALDDTEFNLHRNPRPKR